MDRIKHAFSSPHVRKKNIVPTSRIFGVPLEELIFNSKLTPDTANDSNSSNHSAQVPYLVDRICRFIFANGLDEEGIFRVNGNTRTLERLKESFEKTGDAELESINDIYAVAGLLKLFLRELPDAVIPENMTTKFIECHESFNDNAEVYVSELKILISALPPCNRNLLKYITRFLVDVAANENNNKMNAWGLAIVFGPNLFRCSKGIEGLHEQGVLNTIIRNLVKDYALLFGDIKVPGPFALPLQNRERKKQAPARPPPPKLTESSYAMGSSYMESSDEIRPLTAQSQESILERASPFTIDNDAHSSIASPVLSQLASDLVSKTISEAVNEHLFTDSGIRTIFDQDSRSETPLIGLNSNVSYSERPQTTSADIIPQPRPRTSRQNSQTSLEDEVSEMNPNLAERPKPKPRTKSAPARHGFKDALHQSIDMPLLNGHLPTVIDEKVEIVRPESNTSKRTPQNPTLVQQELDFDVLRTTSDKLTHFTKPKGPIKKVTRKVVKNLTSESTIVSYTSLHDPQDMNNNINNSEKNDDGAVDVDVPKLDLSKLNHPTSNKTESTVITQVPSSGMNSKQPAQNTDQSVPHGTEPVLLSSENIAPQSLPTENHSPELNQRKLSPEDEQKALQIKNLNKKINTLKKKIKSFEDTFESEHGHKPSTQEKNSKVEVKKALAELSKARKELKQLKESTVEANSREDSAEPTTQVIEQIIIKEPAESRPESVVNVGTSGEPPTMADTLDLLLKRLKDKRKESNRPDDLNTLTRDQIQDEKLAVQKALLHFESIHGRPQTKAEKELMKPLYDRYRLIKKCLASAPLEPQKISNDRNKVELVDQPIEVEHNSMIVTMAPIGNGDDEERAESLADSKNHKEQSLNDLSLQELRSELEKANTAKKKLRKLLRDFEDEFQREQGRKVQRDDRGTMEPKYHEYKLIKARIKVLETHLAKQE